MMASRMQTCFKALCLLLLSLQPTNGGIMDYLRGENEKAEETTKYKAYAAFDAIKENVDYGHDSVLMTKELAHKSAKKASEILRDGYDSVTETIEPKNAEETAKYKAYASIDAAKEKASDAYAAVWRSFYMAKEKAYEAAKAAHGIILEGYETAKEGIVVDYLEDETTGNTPSTKPVSDKASNLYDDTKASIQDSSRSGLHHMKELSEESVNMVHDRLHRGYEAAKEHLQDTNRRGQQRAEALTETVQKTYDAKKDQVTTATKKAVNESKNKLHEGVDNSRVGIETARDAGYDKLHGVYDSVTEKGANAVESVQHGVHEGLERAKDKSQAGLNVILDKSNEAYDAAKERLEHAYEQTKETGQQGVEALTETTKQTYDMGKDEATTMTENVANQSKEKLHDVYNSVTEKGANAVESVQHGVHEGLERAKDKSQAGLNVILDKSNEAYDAAKERLEDAYEQTKETGQQGVEALTETAKQIYYVGKDEATTMTQNVVNQSTEKLQEGVDNSQVAIEAAKDVGHDTYDAVSEKSGEAEERIREGYDESGIDHFRDMSQADQTSEKIRGEIDTGTMEVDDDEPTTVHERLETGLNKLQETVEIHDNGKENADTGTTPRSEEKYHGGSDEEHAVKVDDSEVDHIMVVDAKEE